MTMEIKSLQYEFKRKFSFIEWMYHSHNVHTCNRKRMDNALARLIEIENEQRWAIRMDS